MVYHMSESIDTCLLLWTLRQLLYAISLTYHLAWNLLWSRWAIIINGETK